MNRDEQEISMSCSSFFFFFYKGKLDSYLKDSAKGKTFIFYTSGARIKQKSICRYTEP